MERYRYHEDGTLPTNPNVVFVFGSNLAGIHGAGAALIAVKRFGARYGVGEGLTGRSYAIPTKDHNIITLSLKDIAKAVRQFIEFAKEHSDMQFWVTRVGCGLAGYKDQEIAPLFVSAPANCNMPMDWKQFLE
jgi:hypothetical protein